MRAITSRTSYCFFRSTGTMPSSSATSNAGSRGALSGISTLFLVLRLATMRRAIDSA